MTPGRVYPALVLTALALVVSAAALLSQGNGPGAVVPPCAGGRCEPRDMSAFNLFSGLAETDAAQESDTGAASVEDVLEKGLALAEVSPVHLAFRGTADDGSVRCEWRGIARTPEQREQAIRFWLDLDENDALPSSAEIERRFMAELQRINPIYPETVKSNFRAIARGGLSPEYLVLACYADYTVHEYLLGPAPRALRIS